MNGKIYQFNDFRLNLKQRKLLHRNSVVQISSRAFGMLLLLVQQQDEVVEKTEI